MKLILALLTCATCLGTAATASEASGKAARTCRILFLAPPDNARESAFLHDGKTSREVALPSMNLSDVYELPAGRITLTMLSQAPVEGQPLPPDAPFVIVPETIEHCYLIVAMDSSNTVIPLQMRIIDANPSGFRTGQMMWFNLSPHLVGGVLGKTKLNLKPQSQAIVDAPAGGFENYPVTLGYLPESGKPAEPLCSTFWRHNPEARSVLFVMMSPNSKIPAIRSFSDSRLAAR